MAYPFEEWERLEDRLQQFPRFSSVVKEYKRVFVSSAQECPLDSQGRILIPPELRERVGLKDKVLFVGMIDSFEIWNRDVYMDKYASMTAKISEIEEQLHRLSEKNGT